jgi:hypothetical protein
MRRKRGAGNAREGDMIETRITRRRFNTALAGSAAAAMFPTFARAQQNYPNRPVRFILPFGAAGVADITSRLAAEKLGDKLGQRFVVENQPGPGALRRRAPCSRRRPTAIRSASSPTAPRSAPPSTRRCRSIR